MHAATRQQVRPEWLRYTAAGQYSGLGRGALTKLVRDGQVRVARLGKSVLINRKSLDEYLERQTS